MESITKTTIPANLPQFAGTAEYLCYHCVPADRPAVEMSLEELHENQPTWDTESMMRGLTRLSEVAASGPALFDVYSPEEAADHPDKKDVKVWFMPAKGAPAEEKPWILSCSGGAYTCVCSIVESIPTAARLNELGYNVFVATYRVMQPELMPMPLDDLAAAIRFIQNNKETFGITTDEYIVNGYSAGANLTCLWGTESRGWKRYGLPRPKAMLPIYPVVTFDGMYEEGTDIFLKLEFGENYDPRLVRTYDVSKIFTDQYPPCYIVHAKDDPVVPFAHSVLLKQLLDEAGIEAALELAEHGSHGFGDGSGTDAAGWPDRAAAWLDRLGTVVN